MDVDRDNWGVSPKDILCRRYLELIGSGAVASVTGCTSDSDGGDGTGSGHPRVDQDRTATTISPVMMGSKFTER